MCLFNDTNSKYAKAEEANTVSNASPVPYASSGFLYQLGFVWTQTIELMEIKDKEGQVRIKFSDFKKQYGDDEPVFIDLLVEITMNNAIAKEAITIELSDFDEFIKNLKRLDETLKKTFFFQHIDEQLQIKFEPQITGNINVTGFLKDKQYVNTLNFSFEMPPTEISYVIRQSENIIDVLA